MARVIKYLEIHRKIREQMLAGEYPVGSRLPTEKELAAKYGVSVHTVRQAMALFSTEGVIRKIAGSGTFIREMPGRSNGRKVAAKNIGVIVWGQTRHMFPEVLHAVEEEVFAHGFHNIACSTGRDPQREREIIERLVEQGIRGFIISPISWDECCLENYRYIQERSIPLVIINRRTRGIQATSIVVNNEVAGYMATRRLLETGHRRIGHLTSAAMWPELTDNRIQGYRRALEEFGVPFDGSLVVYDKGRDPLQGLDGAMELLSLPERPTGVFCVNDEHVPGLVEAAARLGLSIPGDLSVVGFDKSLGVHSRLPFRLDSFNYPSEQVGICAARELLEQIDDPGDYMVKTIALDPIPAFGNSCCNPRSV